MNVYQEETCFCMHRRPLVVLLVLVVAQVFLCGCTSSGPQDFSVSSSYTLHITTDTRIENVTLLVPIPARGDLPAIGHDPISDAFYANRFPEHITPAIVPIDGQYYLRLTAPFLSPAEPVRVNYENYTSLAGDFRPEIVPQMVETRYPFGNESLFLPKQNLALTAGSPEAVETRGINPGCRYSYTIPVYAYCENGSRIEVYSTIWGRNGWVEQFDAGALNQYSDRYHLVITGEPQGWMAADGVMTAGEGIYREWQLNASTTSGSGE
ncbi:MULTISPECIES: hypothetical protein [Methanoculleus]|nr:MULTISPECIES: hypothetical protein [Methanoculleus]UYU19257.1 hypothetical protein OH143_03985 [Methanoculleus submarinus]